MTIYDVSKQSGVSIATVSRVINGNANVRPKTRKKVLDVIAKSGYTPNAFARGLGLNTMRTIGILCADSSDIYLAKAVYYIEEYLRKNNYNSVLACTGYDIENKRKSLDMLMSQHVDGVVMIGSNFVGQSVEDNQYILDAAKSTPVMLLNADVDSPNIYCTLCDDLKAMQDTVGLFLDKGIQDVLYLYNSRSYSGLKKLAGCQSAYLMRSLPIDTKYQRLFEGARDDVDGVVKFLESIKAEGLKFSAIVASDDILASASAKFAIKNGMKIPDDIQIVGYNNSIISVCCEPELTSVENRLEKMCAQLVKTLISALDGEEPPQKVVFSGELIQRASTRL